MTNPISLAELQECVAYIRARTTHKPRIGLILGTGLSPLAEEIEDATVIPYHEIPHFPVSTVEGHAGRLVIGEVAGVTVFAMQGRFHFYEGYTLAQVTLPVRVMKLFGIETLIVTNAAGGVNNGFDVGDVMLIEDHINFVGMGGHNPLMGPNDDAFGTRFPPMNRAYTSALRLIAQRVAEQQALNLRRGVYAWLAGPNFETPAEIRMWRTLGADAVGMSTVPEVIVAHHAGMQVLAFSTITNICIDEIDVEHEPTHEEVNEAGKIIVPRLTKLVKGILKELAQ